MDYNTIFYAGIVLPTAVTVTIFVVFLVCWFKFHLKERILALAKGKNSYDEAEHGGLPNHIYTEKQAANDFSETASDSAIDVSLHDDVGKAENSSMPAEDSATDKGKTERADGIFDAAAPTSHRRDSAVRTSTQAHDRSAHSSVSHAAIQCTNGHELLINPSSLVQHRAQGSTASSTVTVADVHVHVNPTRLKKGTYPSIETLVEERSITSPNKLYECSDRMRDFAQTVRAQNDVYAPIRRPLVHWPASAADTPTQDYTALTRPKQGSAVYRLARTASHCSSCHEDRSRIKQNGYNPVELNATSTVLPSNHLSGYGSRPSELASDRTAGQASVQQWQQSHYHSSSALTWMPNVRGSTSSNNDNYSAISTSRV